MRWTQSYLLILVCLLGCQPLTLLTRSQLAVEGEIQTNNRLRVEDVVRTDSRVVLEMSPVSDGGRVRPVPILRTQTLDSSSGRIAVLDLDGLLANQDFTGPYSLGENPVGLFREKLEAIACDPLVKAVVLRINTPGGSVTATDILYHDLQAFRARTRLPVVACLLDVAAGGGYYLATGADEIVSHPTSLVGGIGVILNLYNLREMLGQFNIVPQEIKAGKHIDIGSPLRNLPEDARDILNSMAQEYHTQFKDIVRRARPALKNDKDQVFDGRVFTGREAFKRGLVDRLGYLDDAIAIAQQRAGCPTAIPVLFRRANDPGRSPYSVTPNVPLQATMLPFQVPGLERSRLPTFLYLWQPETGLPRLTGR